MTKFIKPYISPETTGDFITIAFTLGIVIYCSWELVRLYRRISKLNNELEKFDKDDENTTNQINNLWASYKLSFNSEQKTKEDAVDYFNEQTLILKNSNFRYFLSLPSTFVGLGILGTFVGLVYGISSFDDFNDSQQIKNAIQILIAGMATAFYTSVIGMAASILFNILEKRWFHSSYQRIKIFANNLNIKHKMTSDYFEAYHREFYKKVIYETFSYTNSEGNLIPPSTVFHTIDHELKEQSKALKSFSTDLANGLEAMSAVILDEFDQSFQKAFKETLLPAIQKLDAAVAALQNEKASSNQNLINSTISSLKEVMQKMMEDFKEHLSGSAKQELESLLKVISASSHSLNEFPDFISSVKTSLEETSQTLKDIIQESHKTHREGIEDSKKERMALTESSEIAMKNASNMIASASGFVEKFTKQAEVLSHSLQQYNHLITSLNDTSKNIVEATEQLHFSAKALDDNSKRNIESNKMLSENFEKQLNEITQLNRHHLESYNKIKGSLSEVFEGIDQGLKDYRANTHESLNVYLSEFSDKLSKASSALSGSITELNDGLDGLNEFLGKIQKPQ